ncbi:hypothetical protein MFLAVUS_005554 [Mucor flavus]|uniref:DNA-directed DNA polymerase n=1 Tax=Mucor flavus TaxID=439312 RepID=A0ABP9YZ27_9FUNG
MEQDNTDSMDIPSTPSPDIDEGIFPKLVSIFVNRRKEIKRSMENRDLSANTMSQCNIEQLALKLTTNSMYDCLGSPISWFYTHQLAMYITSKARRILKSAVDTTEQLGYDVVYRDTDSIMVNTQIKTFDLAKQVAEKVKEVVNQKYKLLKIGVNGYIKSTLLLKKKKYAMISVDELELKVDIRQSHFSSFQRTFNHLIDKYLSSLIIVVFVEAIGRESCEVGTYVVKVLGITD